MSKHAGTLSEILAVEGDVVEVGQALAQIARALTILQQRDNA